MGDPPAASPQAKSSFTLFDAADGRRYNVYLKASDFPKLKIAKIRKTLCQVASLQPEDYELYTPDGVCLDTASGATYGSDFGLCEGMVLTIRRYQVPPSVSFRRDEVRVSDERFALTNAVGAASPFYSQHVQGHAMPRLGTDESAEYRRAAMDPRVARSGSSSAASPNYPTLLQQRPQQQHSNSRTGSESGSLSQPSPTFHPFVYDVKRSHNGNRDPLAAEYNGTGALGVGLHSHSNPAQSSPSPTPARPHTAHQESCEAREQSTSAQRQAALQAQLLREASQNRLFGDGTPLRLEDLGLGESSPGAGLGTAATQRANATDARTWKESSQRNAVSPLGSRHSPNIDPRIHQPQHLVVDENDSRISSYVTTHTRAEELRNLQSDMERVQQMWRDDKQVWQQEKAQLVEQLGKVKKERDAAERASSGSQSLKAASSPKRQQQQGAVGKIVSQDELEQLVTTLDFYRHQLTQYDREKCDLIALVNHATTEKAKVEEELAVATRTVDLIAKTSLSSVPSAVLTGSVEQLTALNRQMVSRERLEAENARLSTVLERETRKRRALLMQVEEMKGNIRVIVRMRPCCVKLRDIPSIPLHLLGGIPEVDSAQITIDEVQNTISVGASNGAHVSTVPNAIPKTYDFYRVFGESATQHDLFEEIAPLVQTAVDGVNTAVIAYGQTGSGKTHTILGASDDSVDTLESQGLLPRTVAKLFELLDSDNSSTNSEYIVSFTAIELYNDTVRSIATGANTPTASGEPKCEIRQSASGVTVTGVTPIIVRSSGEALKYITAASKVRKVSATIINEKSSRSHAIFTFSIQQARKKATAAAAAAVTTSRLVFADLAGSERVSRSQSTGERLREAQYINKSLSALGDVVHSLSRLQFQQQPPPSLHPNSPKIFVPYRNSKLTMLLQDCIGGGAKTVLVACIAPTVVPHEINTHETLSTLSFATRVRCVRNSYNAATLNVAAATTSVASGDAATVSASTTHQYQHRDPGSVPPSSASCAAGTGDNKTPRRWKI